MRLHGDSELNKLVAPSVEELCSYYVIFNECRGVNTESINIALGQRHVLQGKFLVTYRLVDSILVFYVTEPGANPFVCLRFVDAASKILVGISKGIDISPRRLSKKYYDLHLLIGRLLSQGVDSLPGAFIHAPATQEKLFTMPTSAADARRKAKKIAKSKGGKSAFLKTGEESEEQPLSQNKKQSQEDMVKVVWDKSGHASKSINFYIPGEALPPPPARVMGAKRRPPAPPSQGQSVMAGHAFQGAMVTSEDEEQHEHLETVENEKVVDDAVVAEETAKDEEEEEEVGKEIAIKDLQEALVLVERWEGQVVAGRLVSAEIRGEVRRLLAPYGLERVHFRLKPSTSLLVNTCLQTASRSNTFTTHKTEGFDAVLAGTPINISYIKYQLPSSSCLPPLQVDLIVAPPEDPTVSKEALIIIRYAANHASTWSLLDTIVTLDLPPEFSRLVRTSHKAQWAPTQSRIRWEIGSVAPGEEGSIQAVISAAAPLNSVGDIFQHIKAEVLYSGWPGKSLSGLELDVGFPAAEGDPTYHPGKTRTFGRVIVRA